MRWLIRRDPQLLLGQLVDDSSCLTDRQLSLVIFFVRGLIFGTKKRQIDSSFCRFLFESAGEP